MPGTNGNRVDLLYGVFSHTCGGLRRELQITDYEMLQVVRRYVRVLAENLPEVKAEI